MATLTFKDRVGWAIAALVTIASLVACGSGAGDTSAGARGCAAGEAYCAACNGGGFCSSQGCPAYACPVGGPGAEAGADASGAIDDGGATVESGATIDASPTQGGVCPADKSVYCADCNGGGFCVSGTCPTTTCPIQDASVVVPPSDAAPTPCGTCGTNQICVRPSCGSGSGPVCNAIAGDSGSCPNGFTYSASCYRNAAWGPGCVPPPCTPPPPFCVDLPAACAGRLTCSCLDANVCRGGGQCGSILNGNEVWCGFA
jgi:hypothetical protein